MRDDARQSAPSPPTEPSPAPARPPAGDGILDDYHAVADTLGGVPSLRWKDNLFQAAFIVVVTGGCALIGWALWGTLGLLGMLIAGLVGSTLLSGLILMVLGWVRGAERLVKKR